MPRFSNLTALELKRIKNRHQPTEAEQILWSKIYFKQLGFKFRRQHSVGPYILDFYCPTKKLAIELDGNHHKTNKVYDQERTKYLNSLDIKVIRFWNSECISNIDHCVKKILVELSKPHQSRFARQLPLGRGSNKG